MAEILKFRKKPLKEKYEGDVETGERFDVKPGTLVASYNSQTRGSKKMRRVRR